MTHTPGPWKLDTVSTSIGSCHKIGPFPSLGVREEVHACVYADNISKKHGYGHGGVADELLANARLIAASPDMLEALKNCLRLASWDDQRRLNISRVNNREGTVEAIQIARKNAVELRERIEKSIRNARAAIAKAEGK